MDKRRIISLIVIALSVIISQSACAPKAAAPEVSLEVPRPTLDLKDLPPILEIPSVLPTTIQDTKLLGAWIRLYNRPGPIFQWDGSLLTGKGMAQLILDQAIPVVWDTQKNCSGYGCSVCYCGDHTCTFDGEYPVADPIYIDPALKADPNALLGTLTHEIYHRMEPFGGVRDTLFEEYSAYAVETQITHAAWPVFGIFDPLVPDQIIQWFKFNAIY
jgi:hypothetical protein